MNFEKRRSAAETRFDGIQLSTTVLSIVSLSWLCYSVSANESDRAEPMKPLVVVACPDDVRLVRLLGRDHLDVQPLFKTTAAGITPDYGDCSARIKELVGFQIYLVSTDDAHPCEACWRERLTQLNPQGEVIEVSRKRWLASSANGDAARLLTLHQALVTALPQLAKELDQHLRDEWYRNRAFPLASTIHYPSVPASCESQRPARTDLKHKVAQDISRYGPVRPYGPFGAG